MKKTLRYLFNCLLCCGIAVALAGCSKDDDDPVPFDRTLLDGYWYAEMPMTGEVLNWRTEEVDEMASYDHVGAIINLHSEPTGASWWGYVYLKDGDIVNFDGIHPWNEDAYFHYTVTPDGHITPDRYLENTPKVEDMQYTDGKIFSKVNGMQVVFTRPNEEQAERLNELFQMLLEAGGGGYVDDDYIINSDVKNQNATEPSRSKRK